MASDTLRLGLLAAALIGWYAARSRPRKTSATIDPDMPDGPTPGTPDGPTPGTPDGPTPGTPDDRAPPTPIAVGKSTESQISGLLAEMDAFFESQGIDTSKASAREVTLMPSVNAHAIPPRAYWPRMAATLKNAVLPIRSSLGLPLALRGYRPPDYNQAVGGSAKSRHMWFEAVDIRPIPYTGENRRRLALEGAALHNAKGGKLKMGLGVYGPQTPSNIHVDTGYKRRVWRDAQEWKNKAGVA